MQGGQGGIAVGERRGESDSGDRGGKMCSVLDREVVAEKDLLYEEV